MRTLKLLLILPIIASALSAESFTRTERLRVERSVPIYETVTKRIPYTRCEERPYARSSGYDLPGARGNAVGLDTLIGITAGAVIGHQIGKGNGKTAAKIIGGIAGGAIANNMRHHDGGNRRPACVTEYELVEERVLSGYENIAYYRGERIVKRSRTPLHSIILTHTIRY